MGCPPERGDNPRALASGLSYVQVDKHGITILYHLHQCTPCIHEIFRAKVGKGGIIKVNLLHYSRKSITNQSITRFFPCSEPHHSALYTRQFLPVQV